jgi:HlyD family secretion protein
MESVRAATVAVLSMVGFGAPAPTLVYGYVDADYARVAPRDGGTLRELRVARGDHVAAEDILFVVDLDNETALRDQARAQLAQSEAQLENLRKGRRTPEIAAIEAQRTQAEASLRLTEAQFRRFSQLPVGEVVSQDRLDQARSAAERDRGRVGELTAQLEVARLAARSDEITAAEAAVEMARANLRQAAWRLEQRTPVAPRDAQVVDTLFTPGEFVPAGAPVVTLLPRGALKLRVFVPETALAALQIGQDLAVGCDTCAPGLTAKISFIAPQAEYAPPVIYSRETRSKLVFMVEARPAAETKLHPGQPIEVALPAVKPPS